MNTWTLKRFNTHSATSQIRSNLSLQKAERYMCRLTSRITSVEVEVVDYTHNTELMSVL